MKLIVVLLLIALGAVLLIAAALAAGGAITVHDGGWLFPGGVASLAVAWFVSLLPAN